MILRKCDKCGNIQPLSVTKCPTCGFDLNNAKVSLEIPDELNDLTKKGVDLMNNGQIEEAMNYFNQAAKLLPNPATYLASITHGLFKSKQYEAALELAESTLKLDPSFDDIYHIKAMSLDLLDNYEEAIQSFEKAISLNPKESKYLTDKGTSHVRHGEVEKGLKCFNQALTLNPNNAFAWSGKAFILGLRNDLQESLNCINKALELNPNINEFKNLREKILKNLKLQKEIITKVDNITQEKPNDSDAWIIKGIEIGRLGNNTEALKCFEKAIELNENNIRGWLWRGRVLQVMDKFEESLNNYDQALKLFPDEIELWKGKGEVILLSEKYKKAQKVFEQALDKFPNSTELLYWVGESLRCQDKLTEAIFYYDKALEIKPHYREAIYKKNITLINRKLKESPQQEDSTYLNIEPKDFLDYFRKGVAYISVGKLKESLAFFDESIKLNPSFFDASLRKGEILSRLGRDEDAIKCYDKALEILPDEISLLTNKATSLSKLKKFDVALEITEDILRRDPDSVMNHLNKGAILASMKKDDEALTSFNKAIELDPKLDKAYYNKSLILDRLGKKEEAKIAMEKATTINPALKSMNRPFMVIGNPFNESAEEITPQQMEHLGKEGKRGESLICKKCYHPVSIGQKFCVHCGAPLWQDGKVPMIQMGAMGTTVEGKDPEEFKKIGIDLDDTSPSQVMDLDNPPPSPPEVKKMKSFFIQLFEAEDLLRARRHDESINLSDKILKIIPHAWHALKVKSFALNDIKRHEESLEITNEFVKYHPIEPEGWLFRGVALLNLERWDEGYRSLQRSLELEPESKSTQSILTKLSHENFNNFKYLLDKYKNSIKQSYKILYNILKEIDKNEWVSFRAFSVEGWFSPESIIKNLDLEFLQKDFKYQLPTLLYRILYNFGPFVVYAGKLDSEGKRTLLIGSSNNIYAISMFRSQSADPYLKSMEFPPYHKGVEKIYESIKKGWEDTWDLKSGQMMLPLRSFYNLESLENYLEELRRDFN